MKKIEQQLKKRRLCIGARATACASFLVLAVIAASSLVRAMSLETIENDNGVPLIWEAASLSEPESITLPITYWDQRADPCDDENRQFEWTLCNGYRSHGVIQGIVQTQLGPDRLPVPAFSDRDSSWQALHDALSINVLGSNPVQPTDNFYRWFHEVPGLSRRIDGRTVTFNRTAQGTYVYGGQDIYPIDDVMGLDATDVKLLDWQGQLHNFGFTAHLGFSIKVTESGSERFEFSGDDDVWVFLNNKLVLDIGGLHGPISGWFQINTDGTVTTWIEKVNDLGIRAGSWVECMRIRDGVYGDLACVDNYNKLVRSTFRDVISQNLDFGLEMNEIVNVDFFYAERSTDGSNTKITIDHMQWPASADCDITAEVIGKVEGSENRIIEFNTSIQNPDPEYPLDLERLAAYIHETTGSGAESEGFLPLDKTSLFYTTTPDDDSSWQPVDISAPDNSNSGFNLATPIRMSPHGQPGDTLYFRYYGESSDKTGTMASTISYYTTLNGRAGVTFDYDETPYDVAPETPEPEEPGEPVDPEGPSEPESPEPEEPEPEEPENPTPEEPSEPDVPGEPDVPTEPENPDTNSPSDNIPVIPSIPSDEIDGGLIYIPPLGEVAFVPNTGVVMDVMVGLFNGDFSEAVLSRAFIMILLVVFAGSFAIYFNLRKYLKIAPAMADNGKSSSTAKSKKVAKMTKATKSKSVAQRKTTKSTKINKS